MKFKNENEIRTFVKKQLLDNNETEIGYVGNNRLRKESNIQYSIFAQGENWADKSPSYLDIDEVVNLVKNNNFEIKIL